MTCKAAEEKIAALEKVLGYARKTESEASVRASTARLRVIELESALRQIDAALAGASGLDGAAEAGDRAGRIARAALGASDSVGDRCLRCGAENTRERSVTARTGERFCGITHHDDWDREVNGVDRRPEAGFSGLELDGERGPLLAILVPKDEWTRFQAWDRGHRTSDAQTDRMAARLRAFVLEDALLEIEHLMLSEIDVVDAHDEAIAVVERVLGKPPRPPRDRTAKAVSGGSSKTLLRWVPDRGWSEGAPVDLSWCTTCGENHGKCACASCDGCYERSARLCVTCANRSRTDHAEPVQGHTCATTVPLESICDVSYDLRCAACVAMRIAAHGPMLPVGTPSETVMHTQADALSAVREGIEAGKRLGIEAAIAQIESVELTWSGPVTTKGDCVEALRTLLRVLDEKGGST